MSEHEDFLTAWVIHEKKPITYKLLSRELNIHVAEAKRALEHFHSATKSEPKPPYATYVLCGALEPVEAPLETKDGHVDEKDRMDVDADAKVGEVAPSDETAPARPWKGKSKAIVLVGEEDLDATKSRFDRITSQHIYSVTPGKLKDPGLLTAPAHDLHTVPKYVKTWEESDRGARLGVISNPSVKAIELRSRSHGKTSVAAEGLKQMSAALGAMAGTAKGGTNRKVAEQTSKSNGTSRGSKPKDAAALSDPSGSSTLKRKSPFDSKPSAVSRSSARSAATLSAQKQTSPKSEDGESDADAEEAMKEAEGSATAVEAKEEDVDMGPVGYASGEEPASEDEKKEKRRGKEDKKKERERREAELRRMMESDEDEAMEDVLPPSVEHGEERTASAEADSTKKEEPKKERQRVQKMRKVMRKERTKNAKGYMVTKEVEVEEPYTDWESDEPAPPAKKTTKGSRKSSSTGATASASTRRAGTEAGAGRSGTAPKAQGGKKGEGKQSTLMSFFGKKQ